MSAMYVTQGKTRRLKYPVLFIVSTIRYVFFIGFVAVVVVVVVVVVKVKLKLISTGWPIQLGIQSP